MRRRIKTLRTSLSKALKVQGAETLSEAITSQKGMFSLLPVSARQAETLRAQHSVYLTDDGRINVAGLKASQVDMLADKILAVL